MFVRKASPRRPRWLRLEPLEIRNLLANLSIANLELVTAGGASITPADLAVGEAVYAKASWNQAGVANGTKYRVEFKLDGVPIDTSDITSNGDGPYSSSLGGWYATVGSHTITANLDFAGAINETNESDNLMSIVIAPTTQSPPQKISNPLPGSWNSQFQIGNYHDVDPTDGVSDFHGNAVTYNGHNAYDIGTPQNSGMDDGVKVMAAADGIVVEAHDGEFDRQTAFLDPPAEANHVIVDHGNGWQTIYWHLRRDSVRVKVGDAVTRGQLLGYMGSSGNSTGSHLHFGLQHHGAPVETFYQPSSYWITPPNYALDNVHLLKTVLTNYVPSDDAFEGPSQQHLYNQASGQINAALAYYTGLKQGDVLNFRWLKPDNSLYNNGEFDVTENHASSIWDFVTPLPDVPDVGIWHVEYLVNGVLMGTENFTVSASASSPEIRVQDGTAAVVDNRYTPFDFGPIAQNATAPTHTFSVVNHGTGTLNISNLILPAGFSVVDALSTAIAPGAQDSFTVALDTAVAGYFAGQIKIVSNDADEPVYNFSLEGLVEPVSDQALSIGIGDRQINEAGAVTVGHVRRTGSTAAALTVNLTALSSGELTFPASVIIPAAETEAIFTIQAINDHVIENLETIGLKATATGYSPGRNEVDVVSFNAAPVINTSVNVTLGSLAEDTPVASNTGVPVSDLLGGVTDPDTGAAKGIAVIGLTEKVKGTWQFSTNGGATWTALGSPSDTAARLLAPTNRVRFLPNLDYNGAPQLTFRAWDQSNNIAAGSVANTTGQRGGTGAYSAASKSAKLTVTPVNDKPVLTLSGSLSYVRNAPAVVLAPSATVADVDSANFAGGELRVHITAGAGANNTLAIGGSFTVDASNNVLLGSTIIGTRTSNGVGANELKVTFNANATKAIVQQLVRTITYKNVNGAAGQRLVNFSVSDGDGGLSDEKIKTVNVS